jgi:hypothetical protein
MGVFDDKKFEELDWISQATEPIDSELNELLEKLPDELAIDFNTYMKLIGDRTYGIDMSLDTVIHSLLQQTPSNEFDVDKLSYNHRDQLKKCFKFEASTNNLTINFETRSIDGGELKLIKTATTLDEDTLKNMLGYEGICKVSHIGYLESSALGRINEIMELLGDCQTGLRTRSYRRKRHELVGRMQKLFKNNEWNIKDTGLADKVGFWIHDYIKEGNLAALSNFCRIKVMTHKGQPIYSMEEVE